MVRNEVLNRANFDILEAATKTFVFFGRFFWRAGFWECFFFHLKIEKTNGITGRKRKKKETCRKILGINYQPQLERMSEPSTGLSNVI